MNKRLRPFKSSYQIKEEQVNFLLEDIERNLEYKKTIEIKLNRVKQLPDAEKILKSAKTSYNSIVRERIEIIYCKHKTKIQSISATTRRTKFIMGKRIFSETSKKKKKYKNVVYKEETDSETD